LGAGEARFGTMTLLSEFLKHGEREYTHKRLGLDRIREVLAALGNPHQAYPSVLIAGTNGKGSVARMVEAVLLQAGHRAGLYTSPHLASFEERIRIAGQEIAAEDCERILADFVKAKILSPEGGMLTPAGEALTWFEKTTVLAFEAFRRAEVSLAVLEVGLGARLDATNVSDPIVSAVTSIGKDHTEVLGDSPFDIAREKSAVMRPGRPLVLGPMEAPVRTFLMKAARMAGAHPVIPPWPEGDTESFSYGPFSNLSLGLKGRHQLGNAATAIEILVALKEAGWEIDNRTLREGLSRVRFPGRFELFEGRPALLFDGAHNEPGWESLARELSAQFSGRPLTLVLGTLRGRSGRRALEIFQKVAGRLALTEVPSPRSLSVEEWRKILASPLSYEETEVFSDPAAAWQWAREKTPREGLIVVAGSLYLVGALRKLI